MAKQTGLGDNFYVGVYDLSGDVGSLSSITASRAVIDVTGLNKTGYERVLGRNDGSMAFNAYYNPGTGQSHPVLSLVASAAGTTQAVVSYAHGTAVGNDMASLQAVQADYPITVGADLSIAVAPTVQAAAGSPVEWGRMHTNGRQVYAGTAAGTSYDHGAAASFGASAYLHAFAIGSGTATVTVQDSANNSTFADVAGLTWTVTAPTASRVTTAAITSTVRQYTRVNVAGTFTNLDFIVNLVRYPTAQV